MNSFMATSWTFTLGYSYDWGTRSFLKICFKDLEQIKNGVRSLSPVDNTIICCDFLKSLNIDKIKKSNTPHPSPHPNPKKEEDNTDKDHKLCNFFEFLVCLQQSHM